MCDKCKIVRRHGKVLVICENPVISSVKARKKKEILPMARLVGVDLPRGKRIEVGLTYIYGIGLTTSKKILAETGINPDTRTNDLTEEELVKLRDYIQGNLKVEGDLHREVSQNIKRLMEIGCYRGLRHRKGLPVRGQRTHTNARTRKGPAQANRRQEEVSKGAKNWQEKRAHAHQALRAQEHCRWCCAYQVYVQQHHRQHHRSSGQRDLLAVRRYRRLQGLS